MALSIIWLHDSSQTTIQSHVSLRIRGEDQKVGCTGAPTNAILAPIKARGSEEKENGCECGALRQVICVFVTEEKLTFVYEVKKKKVVMRVCAHMQAISPPCTQQPG